MSPLSLVCARRRVATAAAAFDPLSLSPLGWWDLSYAAGRWQDSARTTLATAATQPIGAVDDRSGQGKHMLAAALDQRPLFQLAGGGPGNLPCATHDGSNDRLTTNATVSSADTTIFVVARSAQGALWGRSSAADEYLFKPSGATLLAGYSGSRGGTYAVINDATLWADAATWALYEVQIRPSAATTCAIFRDGTAYATATAAIGTTALSKTFTIGSSTSGGGDAFGGSWGECLFYGSLSTTDVAKVRTYLKGKWGTA